MSATILEVLNTEEKQSLLITAFEAYINKCKGVAKSPMQGYGKATELIKKEQWAQKAQDAQNLLNDIVNELN